MPSLDTLSSLSASSTTSVPSLTSLPKPNDGSPATVLAYQGDDLNQDDDNTNSLRRAQSSLLLMLERAQSQLSFFHSSMRPIRHHIFTRFAIIYVVMAALILGIFSIYWGSMFHKTDHQKYLRMLVVIEDTETIDGVPPIFGNQLVQVLGTAEAQTLGQWHIYTPANFSDIQPDHTTSISQAVDTLIHDQRYWAAIHVKANATHNLYQATTRGDTNYVAGNNTWRLVYETGRDYVNVPAYIVKNCQSIQSMMLADQRSMTQSLLDAIDAKGDDVDKTLLLGWEVISQPLTFEVYDLRPVTDSTVLAPAQVGLIYMVLVTFFQFNMFQLLHVSVGKTLIKPRHYLVYRIASSIILYFWLSLIYSLVSLAFQINFTRTFGRAGFVVYWMTNWMSMTAVGTVNEVMAHLFIMTVPPLLGFWLNFWVIANVSPSFTPMALTADFYNYGYAMPVYNAYEITKVIFFDTYRGHMGRCYGVLVAWVVVANVALVFIIPLFLKVMSKRAQKEAAEKAQAAETKERESPEA